MFEIYGVIRESWAARAEMIRLRKEPDVSLYGTEIPEHIEERIREAEDALVQGKEDVRCLEYEVRELGFRHVPDGRAPESLRQKQQELSNAAEELRRAEEEYHRLLDIKRVGGNRRTFSAYREDFRQRDLMPLIVLFLFSAVVFLTGFYAVRFVKTVRTLDYGLLSPNTAFLTFSMAAPFLLWVWSTCYAPFRRWRVKFAFLRVCIVNLGAVTATQIMRILSFIAAERIIPKTRPSIAFSGGELVLLCAAVSAFLSLLAGAAVSSVLLKYTGSPEGEEAVQYFRIDRYIDMRKNKEFLYDQRGLVRVFETGRAWVTKMEDRFLHAMIDGATGTGKTSILVTEAVLQDLTQYLHNLEYQKKRAWELLKAGRLRLKRPIMDEDFSLSAFEPVYTENERENGRLKEELKFLTEVSSLCGITAIGPNDKFTDELYEMAKNRGIPRIYRIDPIRIRDGKLAGSLKEDFYGFNPLCIDPELSERERDERINTQAQIIKDSMNQMNKMNGSVDSYFEGVNSTQTLNISILLMLVWRDMHGVYPTLEDELELLTDFNRIRRPLYRMVQLYGNHGLPCAGMRNFWNEAEYPDAAAAQRDFGKYLRDNNVDCKQWQVCFNVLYHTLLDETAGPVQYERANGLRNQVQGMLSDERARTILCSQKSINIDRVLEEGGFIVYNYALELGDSVSGTLGRLFTVSYSKAVLRRNPGKFLIPFFTYIDEFPTILNQQMEELFSLHRQYRNSNTVVLQTLQQMDKSEMTRYFKILLMQNTGCQYLFNRSSVSEMKDYEVLSGERISREVRSSSSRSPAFSGNPHYTESVTEAPVRVANVHGSDIRYSDFKEMYVYATDSGSPVKPFKADGDFVRSYDRKAPLRHRYNWNRYWYGEETADDLSVTRDEKALSNPTWEMDTDFESCFGEDRIG